MDTARPGLLPRGFFVKSLKALLFLLLSLLAYRRGRGEEVGPCAQLPRPSHHGEIIRCLEDASENPQADVRKGL